MADSSLLNKAGWKSTLSELSFDTEKHFNITNKTAVNEDKLVHMIVGEVLEHFQNESFLFPSFTANNRVKRTPR